jgi:adenosylmethionine-8-amino-7-oxononanoate aminotransferase
MHNSVGTEHIFFRDPNSIPPVITHADGIYLYTEDGKQILDGASGAAVACLGHNHPRLVKVLADQASQVAFAHLSTFASRPLLRLADRLAALAPRKLQRVYFTSGGSEAVEAAIKLARQYHLERGKREKFKVISRSVSYHGATLGALTLTGSHERRDKFFPLLASFPRIAPPYCYRCPFDEKPDTCQQPCATDLERAIVAEGPEFVSAFIAEPIVGAACPGMAPPVGYYRTAAQICKKYDVLLIMDEVMTGVGRTGKFFAFEHYEAVPDMVCISKGLSSGYSPLGATLVSDQIFRTIKESTTGRFVHGHTFGGNPLSAAVGLEVLNIIQEQGLLEQVTRRGIYLLQRLQKLRRIPIVGDVRGRGLLAGVEFVADRRGKKTFPPRARFARRVAKVALDEGLYVYPGGGAAGGHAGDHVLIAPPYIISEAQIDDLVRRLGKAVAKAHAAYLEEPEEPVFDSE